MTGLTDLLVASIVGGVATASLTPLFIRVAGRLAILDHPSGYKAHARPTPLLGGLSVAAGTLCAALALGWNAGAGSPVVWSIALGMCLVLVAGLLDDLRGLRVRSKLAWQVTAALVVSGGLYWPEISLGFPLGEPALLRDMLVVCVWIVAVINATNFLDNMDGLCAGLGAIAAHALAVHQWLSGEPILALSAAGLGGACLGFLPYNWPRARIFLGDTGSMTLGLALAAFSLSGVHSHAASAPAFSVLLPLLVLAVPILDLLVVVLLRLRARRPVWVGDRCHINHRLVGRGVGPAVAVPILWGTSGVCAVGALLLPTLGTPGASIVLVLLACTLGALVSAAGFRGLS